jgi:flagellar protein FliO/FliZ
MALRAHFVIALSLFFSALASAADAPAKTSAAPVSANPLGMVWGILFLLALVVGAWWLIKRMGGLPMQLNRSMKVVAALSVGARERVVLVEIGGQQLLLGVAPGRVNLLHRFEQPVVVSDAPSDNFGDKIRHVMQQVGPK